MASVSITFRGTSSAKARTDALAAIQSWKSDVERADWLHQGSEHPLLARQAFATVKDATLNGVLRRMRELPAVEQASLAPSRKLIAGGSARSV